MTDYVQIDQQGIHPFKWNSDKGQYLEEELNEDRMLIYLRCECRLVEELTLGGFFDAIGNYYSLKEFISQYSWCRELEAFHTQAKESHEIKDTQEVDFLEVYHWTEVHTYDGITDFDISADFHGLGKEIEGERTRYAVGYSPTYELAHLPLKLNNEVILYEPWKVGEPPKELLRAIRTFSLLDVLDAIYYDISFMGGPQDNINFLEKMSEDVDDIKRRLDEEESILWEYDDEN